MRISPQCGDAFIIRLDGRQNQSPERHGGSRRQKRGWWRQIYQSIRAKGWKVAPVNEPSESIIDHPKRYRRVYGPCGKLP